MAVVKTISMSQNQAAFLKIRGLSASKILQARINKLMLNRENDEDSAVLEAKLQILASKYQQAISFIEKEGLSDVFFEQAAAAAATAARTKARDYRRKTQNKGAREPLGDSRDYAQESPRYS